MDIKEYAEEEARIARRQARAEALAEGRAEGALELVKAMLASGVTAEQLTKQGVPAELIAKAEAAANRQA